MYSFQLAHSGMMEQPWLFSSHYRSLAIVLLFKPCLLPFSGHSGCSEFTGGFGRTSPRMVGGKWDCVVGVVRPNLLDALDLVQRSRLGNMLGWIGTPFTMAVADSKLEPLSAERGPSLHTGAGGCP